MKDLSLTECSEDRARVTTYLSGYHETHCGTDRTLAPVANQGSVLPEQCVTVCCDYKVPGSHKPNRQCHSWSHTCCHSPLPSHLPIYFFLQHPWRRRRSHSSCGPRVMPAVSSRGGPSPGHPAKPRRYDVTGSPSMGTFITTG